MKKTLLQVLFDCATDAADSIAFWRRRVRDWTINGASADARDAEMNLASNEGRLAGAQFAIAEYAYDMGQRHARRVSQ